MKRRIFLILTILLPTLTVQSRIAYAEQVSLSVTGNGDSSQNEVHVETQNTANVTQQNTAAINNEVETNSNTGNNDASSNTGEDVAIQTGSIQTDSSISNENVNSNVALLDSCCTTQNSFSITGNGSESNNQVNITNNTTSNIYQTNNASIINKETTNANTGYNSASNNSGNVKIMTGDIIAQAFILNSNVNNSYNQGSNSVESVSVLISGNGSGSNNTINASFNKDFSVILNNYFYIENLISQNLNTGYNTADGNLGDVSIQTGDIDTNIGIENKDINSNFTHIDCDDCHEEPVCDPCTPCDDKSESKECHHGGNPGTTNGGNNGGSGGSTGGSSGSSSNPIGALLGNMLPATGANLTIWMTLAALIMFFMGWYLRFRSGCAPGFLRA